MIRLIRSALFLGLALLVSTHAAHADVRKSMTDAEARRKAAETAAKQVKAKSGGSTSEAENAYAAAATAHNAWLDAATKAPAAGGEATSDLAARAGTSLVQWISAKNRALGLPDLTGEPATNVAKAASDALNEIAAAKQADAAKSLSERLRWKTWAEIR